MSLAYSMPTMDSSCTLIVHSLPHNTTPDALANQMARWGPVDRVLLCPDPGYVHPDTLGSLIGPLWALVAFVDPASALEALNCCNESNAFQLRRYRSPTDPPFSAADKQQMVAAAGAASAATVPSLAGQLDRLDVSRARCAELQAENQRLASVVYDKDKATRLLLANVEAWKQKLDCVEKCKAQDVQRLQSFAQELDRIGEQLVGGIGAMRAQLEERRLAEMNLQAGERRLQELERENAALLNILHGKYKDNPTLLQLLASLQTVKQDLRLHETEHTRLAYLLGQRDKQCNVISSRLTEAKTRLERLAWEQSGAEGQQQTAASVRELVIERDRLKAQLAAMRVGRDNVNQQLNQLQKQQQQIPSPPVVKPSTVALQCVIEEPSSGVASFDEDTGNNAENDKENESMPVPAGVGTPKANNKPLAPIGSGRRSKISAKAKAAASPSLTGAAASSACKEPLSPSNALTAAFNRVTVGSSRPPLGSLQLQ